MATASVITLAHVRFGYNGATVLDDVSLEIPAGDFVCLIGPNGGGKTTLLKLLVGLLKPESGEIRLFGRAPAEARARIGYLPQRSELDRQFPASVLDVVLMGRLDSRLLGPYRPRDRRAALAALEEVEMGGLAGRSFAELSGGQRQRVLIARALCGEPQLLLLDEPTANVDALVGERLLALLKKLNERMTVLLVSHDLAFVSPIIKTVLCVNRKVRSHPMSALTGDHIRELYGGEVYHVRHDREVSGKGPADA